jgi:D-3-phosphoglycerate dehydrogenase
MSEKKRVIVLDDLAPEGVERLVGAGFQVELGAGRDEAELPDLLPGCHALIVGPARAVTADLLRAGRDLQVVGRAGAGVDGVDVAEATRRGVLVVHTPHSNAVSEAEQALAMLLACARDLARTDADLRDGRWLKGRWADSGVELRGKTLGLVGLAASSPLLAEAARVLRMTVLSCDPRGLAASAAVPLERAEPEQVYAQADFIVVQLPDGAARFGEAELAALKPGVRVVCLSGPDVLDRAALVRALESGHVAAAAVEVSADEAPSSDPLAHTANVLLTAHLDAATVDARVRAGISVAEAVAAALRGEFPAGVVNVPVAAGDDAAELMAYVPLCDQLGRLLVQLADDVVDAVAITYGGSVAYFDTGVLTLSVLGGVLADRADGPVNFVNAQGLAGDLGVTATEQRQSEIPDFPRLITVTGGGVTVAGTSLGPAHKPRLVRVFGEDVDIQPAEHMAVLRYVDAAGIGGKVGTLLGEWQVNIAHMSVGRGRLGDEAVMALTLDQPLTAAQADELVRSCGLQFARAVEL